MGKVFSIAVWNSWGPIASPSQNHSEPGAWAGSEGEYRRALDEPGGAVNPACRAAPRRRCSSGGVDVHCTAALVPKNSEQFWVWKRPFLAGVQLPGSLTARLCPQRPEQPQVKGCITQGARALGVCFGDRDTAGPPSQVALGTTLKGGV